jgi:hypothetical protein
MLSGLHAEADIDAVLDAFGAAGRRHGPARLRGWRFSRDC